jgi:hypothetical protein
MAVLHRSSRTRIALGIVAVGAVIAFGVRTADARVADPVPALHAVSDSGDPGAEVLRAAEDSLRGRSGKLRMRFLGESTLSFALPLLERIFGGTIPDQPGVYTVADSLLSTPFSFVRMRPFADKVGSRLGNYLIGFWPGERGRRLSDAYGNPDGFIEVTPQNQDLRVSEHFRLRDFLTHGQDDVWPKYLVLREDLVDKLELVIDELERSGIPVDHMNVMSGFRTPHYNANGGETGGRASLSRHMYGDAADVFVDNDDDGRMDDLNHDGRVDWRDARVVQQAVERVERAHPDLIGGVGVYKATRSHGPFAHVDVRGSRARWGLIG